MDDIFLTKDDLESSITMQQKQQCEQFKIKSMKQMLYSPDSRSKTYASHQKTVNYLASKINNKDNLVQQVEHLDQQLTVQINQNYDFHNKPTKITLQNKQSERNINCKFQKHINIQNIVQALMNAQNRVKNIDFYKSGISSEQLQQIIPFIISENNLQNIQLIDLSFNNIKGSVLSNLLQQLTFFKSSQLGNFIALQCLYLSDLTIKFEEYSDELADLLLNQNNKIQQVYLKNDQIRDLEFQQFLNRLLDNNFNYSKQLNILNVQNNLLSNKTIDHLQNLLEQCCYSTPIIVKQINFKFNKFIQNTYLEYYELTIQKKWNIYHVSKEVQFDTTNMGCDQQLYNKIFNKQIIDQNKNVSQQKYIKNLVSSTTSNHSFNNQAVIQNDILKQQPIQTIGDECNHTNSNQMQNLYNNNVSFNNQSNTQQILATPQGYTDNQIIQIPYVVDNNQPCVDLQQNASINNHQNQYNNHQTNNLLNSPLNYLQQVQQSAVIHNTITKDNTPEQKLFMIPGLNNNYQAQQLSLSQHNDENMQIQVLNKSQFKKQLLNQVGKKSNSGMKQSYGKEDETVFVSQILIKNMVKSKIQNKIHKDSLIKIEKQKSEDDMIIIPMNINTENVHQKPILYQSQHQEIKGLVQDVIEQNNDNNLQQNGTQNYEILTIPQFDDNKQQTLISEQSDSNNTLLQFLNILINKLQINNISMNVQELQDSILLNIDQLVIDFKSQKTQLEEFQQQNDLFNEAFNQLLVLFKAKLNISYESSSESQSIQEQIVEFLMLLYAQLLKFQQ